MAELVDALASGASVRMDVEVRVLFWAPIILNIDHHKRYKSCAFCQSLCIDYSTSELVPFPSTRQIPVYFMGNGAIASCP